MKSTVNICVIWAAIVAGLAVERALWPHFDKRVERDQFLLKFMNQYYSGGQV